MAAGSGGVLLNIGTYSRADAIREAAGRLKQACHEVWRAPMLLEENVIDDNGGIHHKLATHLQELNDALGNYVKEISNKQPEEGDDGV